MSLHFTDQRVDTKISASEAHILSSFPASF